MRQASVMVADELTFSLNGKFNVFGVYTTAIHIPADPSHTTQLIFLFIIETSPDDPYQMLSLHVQLPGGDSRFLSLSIPNLRPGLADQQQRWCLKYPLLFQNPILRPGPIEAKVIHEKGEILTAAPFIILQEAAPPSPAKH
jgi:hypothetical protein